MNKKSKNMEESKAILKEKCLASCPQECVGGPDWNPKCIQVQGGWVGCPSWNDCKLKVPDQACLAKCKGKKTFGKLKAKVKQAALKVLMKILEGIKKLFSLGKSFFDKSKKLIDSAAVLYGKVTEKVKAGVDAAKEIAKHAIGNIIKIESMCFTSSLESAATSACVEFNINATILKTRKLDFFAKGCLDVSFAKTIGKAVADKLYPGINMVKSGLDGVKKMFAKIDSDKAEVETSMANADMEAKRDDDSDDNGKAAKRHIVWTTEELYFKKLAYEELPRFTLKDSETMAAFEENSPAIKILNSNPMERAIIQPISLHMKLDASFKRDTISNKSLLTPEKTSSGSCQELSNVVRSYSNISGGLSELTDSVKKQHQQFEVSTKRRRSIIHKLAKRIRIVCSHNKCTEDDLENAIFFTRKAHDGILSWADNVRTKLKEQDAVTLDVWKKTLILNLKSSKDIGLNEYLDKLNNVGVNAYDRMEIPKADTAGNIPKLNMISSTLKELLNNSDKVPLSEAVPLIERLGAQVKDIRGSFSQACDTSSHPDDVRVL